MRQWLRERASNAAYQNIFTAGFFATIAMGAFFFWDALPIQPNKPDEGVACEWQIVLPAWLCYNDPQVKWFFSTLLRNIIACFRGRMILWHALAILLTLVLVESGFDWEYYLVTRHPVLISWMFHAAELGMFLPFILPLALILEGRLLKNVRLRSIGWAIGQAELIGSLISSFYKAFTGRAHPAHLTAAVGPDISAVFHFGFLRGGVFWGWPSSHTTIAFAMAVTVYKLFPTRKGLGALALVYALYIGVGVSMTIHWFSDFVAGAIIGAVIGTVVGKSFAINGEKENGASEGI